MNKTPVVIVGAGPCGLATACGLLGRGIPARVIDASPEAGTGSRAVMLWPPVLDMLDELGVLAAAEQHGYRPRALAYHTSRRRTIELPLDDAHGALVLQQDRTSRLLEAALVKLGGRVERPVRVTRVVPGGDSVVVNADGPDGPLAIEADWLIGADGAHSTVRKQLDIEFTGSEFATRFLLAEGKLDGDLDRRIAHYHITPAGVLVLIALPGGEVRISGALDDPGEDLSLATVQRMLDRRGPGGLRVSAPSLLTTFPAPHRIAATMRVGRCFLVGDAAHIHSPAGGQGLSLGMQDVRNLVWKLAGAITGRLDPAILDTYDQERRAAAQQVVASIHKLTRQTLFPPMALRARNLVLHLVNRTGRLQGNLLASLSGRRIQYPDVLFGEPSAPRRKRRDAPVPGAPAPLWVPRPGAAAPPGFRLVTTGPDDHELALAARTCVARAPLADHHHRADASPAPSFVLVRPDGYVAASGTTPAELAHAWQRLARLLTEPRPAPTLEPAPASRSCPAPLPDREAAGRA